MGHNTKSCTISQAVRNHNTFRVKLTNRPFESQYDNCGAPGQQTHNALSHQSQNNLTAERPKTAKTIQQSKHQKSHKFHYCVIGMARLIERNCDWYQSPDICWYLEYNTYMDGFSPSENLVSFML